MWLECSQAAAQRMAEAKRRVGRAMNRREVAKASVARAREAYASQDTTLHGTLPPLRLDLRNKSELTEACSETLQRVTMGNKCPAPFRLRCFTHKANQSWQRGTVVLGEHEKPQLSPQRAPPPPFPTIKETTTPTYPMMRPRYIIRSLTSTPFQSELTELSPASSDMASLTHLCP